jgi:hypothetical protein
MPTPRDLLPGSSNIGCIHSVFHQVQAPGRAKSACRLPSRPITIQAINDPRQGNPVAPVHEVLFSIEALFFREAATYVADDLRPASCANRGLLKMRGDLAEMPLDLAHPGGDVVERVYLPKLKLG